MNSEKFIILSDIHSNIYALTKFLQYIKDINTRYSLNRGSFLQKSPILKKSMIL